MAQPQNVNAPLVATAGLTTTFVVLAIIIATHGWFHYEMDEELALKSQIVADPTIPQAIAKAKANLTKPDEKAGQISIQKAKELYISMNAGKGKTAQAPQTTQTQAQ